MKCLIVAKNAPSFTSEYLGFCLLVPRLYLPLTADEAFTNAVLAAVRRASVLLAVQYLCTATHRSGCRVPRWVNVLPQAEINTHV